MNLGLKGRACVVTGASRGIGRETAIQLCGEGANVLLVSRGEQRLREVQEEADGAGAPSGGRAAVLALDVTDADAGERMLASANECFGALDVLVNNAGITRDTLIVRMSDAEWDAVMDTNLRGVFNVCRAVARGMLKRRSGAIVNMTSVVGLHGNPGQTNYAASKAGIIGLTKSLAKELGTRGVRVNAVAPGYVTTELTTGLPEELRETILSATALGRLGDPEDVAGAVRFLCSDEARFVTGAVLQVDGGLGM
jgi:3-oxoacyl-[acyl-carrier protein] reductase